MAMEFKSASTVEEKNLLEQETREMMTSVCASPRGETPTFTSTCAKLASP